MRTFFILNHKINIISLIFSYLSIIACFSTAHAENGFPMRINDSLSATFSEYRRGHLHAGNDMRTLRKTKLPVLAPCDGKIIKLSGDENGYGMQLIMEGTDGRKYSFAHLDSFENDRLKLSEFVRTVRNKAQRRFPFEADLVSSDIKVKKGELIAYSGDTGAGPAHLHYEICDASDMLLNPMKLMSKDETIDPTPPVIASFTIQPRDENSFVEGKPLRRFFSLEKNNEDLKFNACGKFALCVRAYDENRYISENASRLGLYKLSFSINKTPVYGVAFDSFHRAFIRKPEYVYDLYYSDAAGGNFYYNMFDGTSGSSKPEYIIENKNGGVFEISEGRDYIFEITAEDYHGNRSLKEFSIHGAKTASVEIRSAAAAKKTTGFKAKDKKNQKQDAKLKKDTAPAPANNMKLEYNENGLLLRLGGVKTTDAAKLYFDIDKNARREIPSFIDNGTICFFFSYEDAVKNPVFYIEIKNAAGMQIFYEGRMMKVYKVTPGSQISGAEFGSFSFVVSEYSNMRDPLYAGSEEVFEVNSPKPEVPGSASIAFSKLPLSARAFYKISAGAVKKLSAGIYMRSGKNISFMGNSSQKYLGEEFMEAEFRYLKRLSVTIAEDVQTPQIKPLKQTVRALAKPIGISPDANRNFLSFSLSDKGSGILREDIKYYLDGSLCGNFEYISGTLNCYLQNYNVQPALKTGNHAIKIAVTDRAKNTAVFEKIFKVK